MNKPKDFPPRYLMIDPTKIDPAKIREAMQRAPFDGKEYPIERAAIQAVLEAIAAESRLADGQEESMTTAETEAAKGEAVRKAEERLTSVGNRKLLFP